MLFCLQSDLLSLEVSGCYGRTFVRSEKGLMQGERVVQASHFAVPAIQASSHRGGSDLLGCEVSESEPAERWRQGVVAAV